MKYVIIQNDMYLQIKKPINFKFYKKMGAYI